MRKDETPNAQFSDEGIGIMLYQADGNIRALADIEADVIRLAIGHYRGRMTEVARRLGIGRSTLYRKLAELGIDSRAACYPAAILMIFGHLFFALGLLTSRDR